MHRTGKFLLLLIALLFLAGCASTGLANRPDVKAFIHRISIQDHFNQEKLTTLFNHVHVHPMVIHHTQAPRETTINWTEYREIFLKSKRISQGANFWATHETTFNNAQQTYGVQPQIIAAIIGVETEYGQVMGKYRVIDSLSTLAFNYPPREKFFQHELTQYLLLTRELNLNPLDLYGSYAGAVGLPQFMPDSYRQLAISAVPGQTPDLWHNPDDAILSVANYFHHKGWLPDQAIAVPAQITGDQYQRLDFSGWHTKYTVGQLARYHIHALEYLPPQTRVNLLMLPTDHGDEYWLACHNFYVIMHYNSSIFYAMAVYQLSEAIAHAHRNP